MKKATRKTTPAAKAKPAAKPYGRRKDLGAPVDGFYARQPAVTQPILRELRALVDAALPDARTSLKWGMPFYMIGDTLICAIGGHKAHVNLILPGPPGTYDDPEGHLTGDGKTGRHLKLTSVGQIPREAVKGWLRTAVALAKK